MFDPASARQYNEPDVAALQLLWDSLEISSETIGIDHAASVALGGVDARHEDGLKSRLNTEMIPKDPEGAPQNT
jgi:hypothetical protein